MADKEKKVKNSPDTDKKSDKKTSAKADKTDGGKVKKGNIFVRMAKGMKNFFKNFKGDIKKIVWPDSKIVLKNTGVVLVCVLIAGVVIFGVDFVLTEILDGVKNLASDAAIGPLFLM